MYLDFLMGGGGGGGGADDRRREGWSVVEISVYHTHNNTYLLHWLYFGSRTEAVLCTVPMDLESKKKKVE